MDEIERLIAGYASYRDEEFAPQADFYRHLVEDGQKPRIAMVACSDSRVEPTRVLRTRPGEVFMIRNVANLVPPFEEQGTFHGTSAALEFAVCGLEVKHIVVFGHAHCGGIKALINRETEEGCGLHFVPSWMSQVETAHRRVLATLPDAGPEERQRACEKNAILVSLENLTTFPWVRERVEAGQLRLHGWYFDLKAGHLMRYDPETTTFVPALP